MGVERDRPQARRDGLIVEWLSGEAIVYDESTDEAHCLADPAAAVFQLCDGTRTRTEIAEIAAVDGALVDDVLHELGSKDLLEEGLSRRQMLRRTAMVGGAAAATPLITSIVAPVPAAAQSPAGGPALGDPCTSVSECPAGASCTNGKCCSNNGGSCSAPSDCCDANAICFDGTCATPPE